MHINVLSEWKSAKSHKQVKTKFNYPKKWYISSLQERLLQATDYNPYLTCLTNKLNLNVSSWRKQVFRCNAVQNIESSDFDNLLKKFEKKITQQIMISSR